MTIIFIRSIIIFTVLLVILRLMGKRQIGEMQPFEFVITLLIAELACIPMADISVPLIYGIAAILATFILHQILSAAEQLGRGAKKIISGKPSLVINKNGVDFDELKKNNMDVEDLIESMRAAGFFSLDELDYAVFESNGKLSAKENPSCDKSGSLPLVLVNNGKYIRGNGEKTGITEEDVKNIAKKSGTEAKRIGVMTVDGNGKVYLQEKGKKYMTFSVDLKGVNKW